MKRPSESIYQGKRDTLDDLNDPTEEIPPLEDDLFYKEYRASQRKTLWVVIGFFLLIIMVENS